MDSQQTLYHHLDLIADMRQELLSLRILANEMVPMLTANLESIWLKFNEIKTSADSAAGERYIETINGMNIKSERAIAEVNRLNNVNISLKVEAERQVRSARQEAQMYLVTVLGTTRKRLVSIHRYSTTTVKQFWLKQFADHLNDLNQLQTMFQRIQQESVDKERRYKENMHEYETKVQELQLLHERSRATIDTLETDRSQLTQELTTFRSASTTEIQSIRTELQALAQEHNVLRNSYTAQNEVTLKVKEEVDVLNIRLRKQQETYTNEHDEWTKERLQLQRQAKSIQLLTDINVVPPLWRQTDKEMYRNNSDHDIFDNDDNSNNIVSFPSAGKRFRKSGTSDDSTLTKGRTLFAITLTPPVPSMDYHLPCTDTDSTLATFPPHRSLINHRAGSVNPSLGIQADKNWYQRLPMIKNTLEKLQSFTGSNENKWSFENNSENSE